MSGSSIYPTLTRQEALDPARTNVRVGAEATREHLGMDQSRFDRMTDGWVSQADLAKHVGRVHQRSVPRSFQQNADTLFRETPSRWGQSVMDR